MSFRFNLYRKKISGLVIKSSFMISIVYMVCITEMTLDIPD
jgi:hypothetical protein